jgi:hypothetical protein
VGGGAVRSIGTFASKPSLGPSLEVAYSANTRATGWVRPPDFELPAALEEAGSLPLAAGKPPSLTPIFGYSFCERSVVRAVEPDCYLQASLSPSYAADKAKFNAMFPLSDTQISTAKDPKIFGDVAQGRGYWEARNELHNLTKLEEHLKNISALGLADKVMVVSVGDEISLKVPSDPAAAQTLFAKWCADHHVRRAARSRAALRVPLLSLPPRLHRGACSLAGSRAVHVQRLVERLGPVPVVLDALRQPVRARRAGASHRPLQQVPQEGERRRQLLADHLHGGRIRRQHVHVRPARTEPAIP